MFKTRPSGFSPRALSLALFAIGAMCLPVSAAKVEKSRAAWQTYVSANCTGLSSNCGAPVYTVPANRRLLVTNVSCTVSVSVGNVPFFVRLHNARKSGADAYDSYLPVFTDGGVAADYSVVNAQTLFVADTGDMLDIRSTAENDVSSLDCKIAGELIVYGKKKKKKKK